MNRNAASSWRAAGLPTLHPVRTYLLDDCLDIDHPFIEALQGVQATDYLNGYGIAVPHLVAERLRVLKAYLGCRP